LGSKHSRPGGRIPSRAVAAGHRTKFCGAPSRPRGGKRQSLDALSDFKPPAAAAQHWADFVRTLGVLRRTTSGWPAEIDLVCKWYGPHLERIHEDAVLREADLLQLVQIAATYPSRERFLTELTLDPPDATSDEAGVPLLDEDYLILSTIHSAKGQEWTSVFVLNTVDGCLPSDLATGSTPEIEEERRLLYVAMTRAKDQLHLMVPQRFFTHGQRSTGDRHVYRPADALHPRPDIGAFRDVFVAAGQIHKHLGREAHGQSS